jgi:hypothetical protein
MAYPRTVGMVMLIGVDLDVDDRHAAVPPSMSGSMPPHVQQSRTVGFAMNNDSKTRYVGVIS